MKTKHCYSTLRAPDLRSTPDSSITNFRGRSQVRHRRSATSTASRRISSFLPSRPPATAFRLCKCGHYIYIHPGMRTSKRANRQLSPKPQAVRTSSPKHAHLEICNRKTLATGAKVSLKKPHNSGLCVVNEGMQLPTTQKERL